MSNTRGYQLKSRKVLFIVLLLVSLNGVASTQDEINHLLSAVASTNCQYERNGTFYSGKEINNRDISHIPHPFVIESLQKFKNLSPSEKNKIIFIHFNHTNPLLNKKSKESQYVIKQGYNIGRIDENFEM